MTGARPGLARIHRQEAARKGPFSGQLMYCGFRLRWRQMKMGHFLFVLDADNVMGYAGRGGSDPSATVRTARTRPVLRQRCRARSASVGSRAIARLVRSCRLDAAETSSRFRAAHRSCEQAGQGLACNTAPLERRLWFTPRFAQRAPSLPSTRQMLRNIELARPWFQPLVCMVAGLW